MGGTKFADKRKRAVRKPEGALSKISLRTPQTFSLEIMQHDREDVKDTGSDVASGMKTTSW